MHMLSCQKLCTLSFSASLLFTYNGAAAPDRQKWFLLLKCVSSGILNDFTFKINFILSYTTLHVSTHHFRGERSVLKKFITIFKLIVELLKLQNVFLAHVASVGMWLVPCHQQPRICPPVCLLKKHPAAMECTQKRHKLTIVTKCNIPGAFFNVSFPSLSLVFCVIEQACIFGWHLLHVTTCNLNLHRIIGIALLTLVAFYCNNFSLGYNNCTRTNISNGLTLKSMTIMCTQFILRAFYTLFHFEYQIACRIVSTTLVAIWLLLK